MTDDCWLWIVFKWIRQAVESSAARKLKHKRGRATQPQNWAIDCININILDSQDHCRQILQHVHRDPRNLYSVYLPRTYVSSLSILCPEVVELRTWFRSVPKENWKETVTQGLCKECEYLLEGGWTCGSRLGVKTVDEKGEVQGGRSCLLSHYWACDNLCWGCVETFLRAFGHICFYDFIWCSHGSIWIINLSLGASCLTSHTSCLGVFA
jgi:hypothetical protein